MLQIYDLNTHLMLLYLFSYKLVKLLPTIVVTRSTNRPDKREQEPRFNELSNSIQSFLWYLYWFLHNERSNVRLRICSRLHTTEVSKKKNYNSLKRCLSK